MCLLLLESECSNKKESYEDKKIIKELTEYENELHMSEVYLGFLYTFNVCLDVLNAPIMWKDFLKCKNSVNLEAKLKEEKTKKCIKQIRDSLIKKNEEKEKENLITVLETKFKNLEWKKDSYYAEEFKRAEEFFESNPSNFYDHMRVKLGGLLLKCNESKKACIFHGTILVELYFTLFKEAEEGILLFNIKLKKCDSNEIIFLRQCLMEDRHELYVSDIIPPSEVTQQFLLDSLDKSFLEKYKTEKRFECKEYVKLIQSAFEECSKELCNEKFSTALLDLSSYQKILHSITHTFLNPCTGKKQRSNQKQNDAQNDKYIKDMRTNIIEIRNIPNIHSVNLSYLEGSLIEKFPKQIYSLLVGDEGWKFVPKIVALSRLSKRWGTRGFFVVFSHDKSSVMFNLTESNHYLRYCKNCSEISMYFGQETEDYFTQKYHIAGLQHGPLICTEMASIKRGYLDTILKALDDQDINVLEKKFKNDRHVDNFFQNLFVPLLAPFLNATQDEIKKILYMKNALNSTITIMNSFTKIWEVNELLMVLNENLSLPNIINMLEDKSKFIESELMTYYQRCTDLVLCIIAFDTLILTANQLYHGPKFLIIIFFIILIPMFYYIPRQKWIHLRFNGRK